MSFRWAEISFGPVQLTPSRRSLVSPQEIWVFGRRLPYHGNEIDALLVGMVTHAGLILLERIAACL
jgi:hypothetical protein